MTQKDIETQSICLLAGFSESHGVVHSLVRTGTINQETLMEWFAGVKLKPRDYFVIMDRWSPHLGKNLINYLEQRKIKYVHCPVYSCVLNAAEG